jgi:NTE family protein
MARTKAAAAKGRSGPTMDAAAKALVLQGGGALGAYQAGVYEALIDCDKQLDWVAGVSIGAINAAIIAGNAPEQRVAKLAEFWQLVSSGPGQSLPVSWGDRTVMNQWSAASAMWMGIPGFFKPRLDPSLLLGGAAPVLSYYDTSPLKATLERLVDFDRINHREMRLSVGAVDVRSGNSVYFDNATQKIRVEHIMASGALPPGFPPVHIDGQDYWDGGILSNTPTEAVFDDNPRKNSLIFAVHLWNPSGEEPATMKDVLNRHKDVQYSSRIASHIARQQQAHRLRHVINQLVARLPEEERKQEAVRELASYGCPTRMHVVRLLAPQLECETHTKDIDFSREGIMQRWDAGYRHTRAVLASKPWVGEFDPLSGVILHEQEKLMVEAAE